MIGRTENYSWPLRCLWERRGCSKQTISSRPQAGNPDGGIDLRECVPVGDRPSLCGGKNSAIHPRPVNGNADHRRELGGSGREWREGIHCRNITTAAGVQTAPFRHCQILPTGGWL